MLTLVDADPRYRRREMLRIGAGGLAGAHGLAHMRCAVGGIAHSYREIPHTGQKTLRGSPGLAAGVAPQGDGAEAVSLQHITPRNTLQKSSPA